MVTEVELQRVGWSTLGYRELDGSYPCSQALPTCEPQVTENWAEPENLGRRLGTTWYKTVFSYEKEPGYITIFLENKYGLF